MRTFRIIDEARFDALSPFDAAALYAAERAGTVEPATVDLEWWELAEANESHVMDEIARLAVGERTVLGQCDFIERIPDRKRVCDHSGSITSPVRGWPRCDRCGSTDL